jgi:hypothetical protein
MSVIGLHQGRDCSNPPPSAKRCSYRRPLSPTDEHSSPATSGNQPSGSREWERTDVVCLVVAGVAGFVLVLMAALSVPPLAGGHIVPALEVIGIVLANASLGALGFGAYVEFRHPDWSRLGRFDHWVMLVSVIGLAAADLALS